MSEAMLMDDTKVEKEVKALEVFADVIDDCKNLEIIGTAESEHQNGNEVFIIRNWNKTEGIDGAYVEVGIAEVIDYLSREDKISMYEKAEKYVPIINGKKTETPLNGITRIVGYYSRVQSWNKSKVGELRDRTKGLYGITNQQPNQEDRLKTIDKL